MNKQEVFDKVATHLLTQMETSIDDGTCLYRGPRGLKCAIGCLIPDGLYTEDINKKLVNELPSEILRSIGAKTDEDVQFLRHLQRIHDQRPIYIWKYHLKNFATSNGLVWKL